MCDASESGEKQGQSSMVIGIVLALVVVLVFGLGIYGTVWRAKNLKPALRAKRGPGAIQEAIDHWDRESTFHTYFGGSTNAGPFVGRRKRRKS